MESFDHLARSYSVLLTTRRRDGRTVDTPVNLAIDPASGFGYFRTWSTSGKAKRIRNSPDVRVAPCTLRGRPTGSDQPGTTSWLSGEDASLARRLITKRWPILHGLVVPAVHTLTRKTTAYFRLVPAEESVSNGA